MLGLHRRRHHPRWGHMRSKRARVLSGSPGTDRVAGTVDADALFLPVSSRSMAKSSPRPPMTRRWRLSARPRSPSWSRFCAEARLLTPRSRTSVPRLTSPFSTSRLSQTCLPPHRQYRSWRSICSLRSESLTEEHVEIGFLMDEIGVFIRRRVPCVLGCNVHGHNDRQRAVILPPALVPSFLGFALIQDV